MKSSIVHSEKPVLLVGGGDTSAQDIALLRPLTGKAVAADSGAAHLVAAGILPDAVIGDMDSLPEDIRAQLPSERVHAIAEQDSTDFDKCLRNIEAPLVLGAGFLGARLDHQMAVQNALIRHAQKRCVLLGPNDLVLGLPPRISLSLRPGVRVSLFPMRPVTGRSTGLRWPIEGIPFSPDSTVGTSNLAIEKTVTLDMDNAGMLLIMPREALEAVLTALEKAETWPAP